MTTILVVDDSTVDRTLAAGLLAKEPDLEVIQAADGKSALALIKVSAPDVIITDLQMPEMNGLELIAAVRKSHSHVPVIMMTSKGSEEIAVEALQAGASSYVPKRALSTMLVDTLQRVLSAMQENRKHSELMNRLSERNESFVIENDVNLLMALSRHLQSLLTDSWGLDRTDRLRIGTALEEALLNAMYHGNLEVSSELKEQDHQAFYTLADQRRLSTPWINRRIYVNCWLSPQEAKFVIRDDGKGFDPATLPDPTDPENLARPFGRGVMLMRAFMDSVSYNSTGNEVTLQRNRFRI